MAVYDYKTGKAVTTETKKVEIDPEIQRAIMAQVIDYKFGPQDEYTKPATYVVAANGTFCVKKTPFGNIVVKAKEVPYLKEMEVGFQLALPKAPYMLFLQAYSFFKAVSDKSKDEAALVLYYNKQTEAYEYLCPKQTVSGAAVKFGECPEYLSRMHDSNYVRVCELHSHNTMSAFHSGTDDGDEIFDCSFLVFGKLDTAKPEHIFSYAASGVRVDSTLWDLFEKPIRHIDLGNGLVIEEAMDTAMFVPVEYPAEWHEQLSKPVYVTSKNWGTGYKGKSIYDYADEAYGAYDDYYNRTYSTQYPPTTKATGTTKTLAQQEKEEDAELEKEIAKKLTDKDNLFNRDYVDELNPVHDPDEVLVELEVMFGSTFMDDIADAMVRKGYGTAWWEETSLK